MEVQKVTFALLFLFISSFAIFDCNSDNRTTSVDALIALKISVGKIPFNSCADANNDGIVTAGDALLILKEATHGKDPLLLRIEEVIANFDSSMLDNTTRTIIERFGNEKIEVVIKGKKELKFWIVIEKGKPKIFENRIKPTVVVKVRREIVERAFERWSVDPLIGAFKSGEIEIEGVGFVNSIKFKVLSAGLKLAQNFKPTGKSIK